MFNFNERSAACFVVVIALLLSATAKDELDNKVDCVNVIIEWCNEMNYGPEDGSLVFKTDVSDSGELWHVVCKTNSEGIICSKNKSPWFSCSSNNTASYKGNPLQKNSPAGTDDEVCDAANLIVDFEEFLVNFKGNMTELRENLKKGGQELRNSFSNFRNNFKEEASNFRDNLDRKLSKLKTSLGNLGSNLNRTVSLSAKSKTSFKDFSFSGDGSASAEEYSNYNLQIKGTAKTSTHKKVL